MLNIEKGSGVDKYPHLKEVVVDNLISSEPVETGRSRWLLLREPVGSIRRRIYSLIDISPSPRLDKAKAANQLEDYAFKDYDKDTSRVAVPAILIGGIVGTLAILTNLPVIITGVSTMVAVGGIARAYHTLIRKERFNRIAKKLRRG